MAEIITSAEGLDAPSVSEWGVRYPSGNVEVKPEDRARLIVERYADVPNGGAPVLMTREVTEWREVGEGQALPPLTAEDFEGGAEVDRPAGCCGKCPPIAGCGYDCTCDGNPRCPLGGSKAYREALGRVDAFADSWASMAHASERIAFTPAESEHDGEELTIADLLAVLAARADAPSVTGVQVEAAWAQTGSEVYTVHGLRADPSSRIAAPERRRRFLAALGITVEGSAERG